MYNKIILILIILLMFSAYYHEASAVEYEVSISNGILNIKNDYDIKDMKVIIEKDNQIIVHPFIANGKIPLTFGIGKYNITMINKVNDNKYSIMNKYIVDLNEFDLKDVFVQENYLINLIEYDSISLEGLSGYEIVKSIYNEILNNYSYNVSDSLDINYIPNLEKVVDRKYGSCYDISVLFASILRSDKIPTKVVKGYSKYTEKYHAWNEVYIDREWIIIDISTDIQLKSMNMFYMMKKDNRVYEKVHEY